MTETRSTSDCRTLDLVRAIAVLIVVARHTINFWQFPETPWFQHWPFGTSGVAIFFVHTSLVLMFSLERHEAKQPEGGFWRMFGSFMIRRAFRIYPLTVIAVLSTVYLFQVAQPGTNTPGIVAANALLVQDWLGNANVLVPLWSLPLEMQMYLFLPGLFVVVRKFGYGAILFGAIPIGLVLAASAHWIKAMPALVPYIPCFLGGVLCYALWRRVTPKLPWWMALVGLVIGIESYMLLYYKTHWMGVAAAPMCLLLGALLPFCRDLPAGRLSRASHVVATYSFGIYLFHEIYMRFFVGRVWNLPLDAPTASPSVWPPLLLSYVATALTTWLLFRWVEKPMIAVGVKVADRVVAHTK